MYWGKWGASVARCSPYRRYPLLLPGAARTALLAYLILPVRVGIKQQSRAPRYRWHLYMGRRGGPIPSEILRVSEHVDPGSAPSSAPADTLARGGDRSRWWSRR